MLGAYRYFFGLSFAGRPNNPRVLHVWFGPLGFHLFWPPWSSQLEWMRDWKDNIP